MSNIKRHLYCQLLRIAFKTMTKLEKRFQLKKNLQKQ
jgi:hypothetical protein